MTPDDAIYICIRVSDPVGAPPGPGSFIVACESCQHPVWAGAGSPRVARRQCIECTPPEDMLAAGVLEDTREAIAAVTGMTDDEITEKMHSMARDIAGRKREAQ